MRIRACLLLVLLAFCGFAQAQAPRLRVGVFERPPFAMKGADGGWSGLAVDVWEKVSADLSLPFEYVELTESEAIKETAAGRIDVLLGEIAVSPDRARLIKFSQSYVTFPAAVAFRKSDRKTHWLDFVKDVFEHGVLSMLAIMVAALAFFSALLWLIERKVDRTHFGGHPIHGFGSALWFAAVTMTTVGYGDKTPQSTAGRMVVFVWMFFGVVAISIFTGTVASSIAVSRLSEEINNLSALSRYHNGVLAGSLTQNALTGLGVRSRAFQSAKDGLDALLAGQINAFAASEGTLRYVVAEEFPGRIVVTPIPNTHESFAFGMRPGLPQRDAIDIALIDRVSQPDWQNEIQQFIGPPLSR